MLPARHSADYKGWLAIQLFELAVALGQQQQLDSDGIRQAAFAEDLADTRPEIMQAALLQWRKTETFLPTAGELRAIYNVTASARTLHDDTAAYLQDYDQHLSMRGTEEAFSVADSIVEVAQKLGIGNLREAEPAARLEPAQATTDICPHCGGQIPTRVADLSRCDAELLRELLTIAERREQRQAESAARVEAAERELADEQALKAARKKEGQAGWQGSVSGPDVPHSSSATPSSAEPNTKTPTTPRPSEQEEKQPSRRRAASSQQRTAATASTAQETASASAAGRGSEAIR